jgi:hypothetical protein
MGFLEAPQGGVPSFRLPHLTKIPTTLGHHSIKFPSLATEIGSTAWATLGVWQEVAMDFLQFYPGPPCPTFLCPAGGPSLERIYGRSRSGPPTGYAACGRLEPLWIPHAICYERTFACTTCRHALGRPPQPTTVVSNVSVFRKS